MVGAVMLGLGRAMGETIAVALVIGARDADHPEPLRERQRACRRSSSSSSASRPGRSPAALIGLGVVLFVMTVLVNYAARLVVRRAEIRMKGAAT